MRMMGLLVAAVAVGFVQSAQANDLSIGGKNSEGQEFPRISLRVQGNTTKIRMAPYMSEIRCSKYRKDLCGHENDVKVVEATVNSKDCQIASPTLLSCDISGFESQSVVAILNDGTSLPLPEVQGTLRVGDQTTLERGGQETFQTVHSVTLQFEIWGDRADGLDPLVVNTKPGLFSGYENLQTVTKSLFD